MNLQGCCEWIFVCHYLFIFCIWGNCFVCKSTQFPFVKLSLTSSRKLPRKKMVSLHNLLIPDKVLSHSALWNTVLCDTGSIPMSLQLCSSGFEHLNRLVWRSVMLIYIVSHTYCWEIEILRSRFAGLIVSQIIVQPYLKHVCLWTWHRAGIVRL